ncbi:MAG TPA: DNA polymerase III subunit delta', partial [Clostridia bacterium]|nr:DNA polymerase III subunit delta' [Clostridia bacterium]
MSVEGASDFQWPSAQAERLFRVFQAGKAGHAYVLNGPAGVGKRTLALLCAQTLFCRAETGRRPCGECPPCLRFAHGNHPDSFLLEAEGSLGVEAVRALSFALQERAYEAGAKAVRILGADRMTVQAQNALLKTLEEPPGRTVFLLACEQST